jgi:hypothetical protein
VWGRLIEIYGSWTHVQNNYSGLVLVQNLYIQIELFLILIVSLMKL